MRPSPIVTGSISTNTRRRRVAPVDGEPQSAVEPAQPRERQKHLDHGPDHDRDRVDVELRVERFRVGNAEDEAGDDREVPEDGRQRRHREVLVAVEDPDDDPGDAEQDDDREKDPGEVTASGLSRGFAERRDDQRRDDDQERRDRAEAEQQEPEQRRRDAPRAFFSPFSRSSLKTGTNADERAASATSERMRFGTWKATVNALILPVAPK